MTLNFFLKFINLLKSFSVKAFEAFDARDFLVFGGLILLGYGLYLLRPWFGLAVTGAILIYMGLFHGSVIGILSNKGRK
ncbi:MAG: hypothetical protein ABFD75_12225 [Smithella sp.]